MSYAIYYGTCDEVLPDHIANSCADSVEHGRVRSVAFINTSYLDTLLADPENYALWQTGILDKLIIIIPETTGTYDGGTPVEGAGYGHLETSLAGYRHVINYKDPNFKDNAEFYNVIKHSRSWVPAIATETQTMIFSVPGTIIPKAPITEDLNSEVVWDVEVRVSQPDIPVPFNTPPNVFESFYYS